MPRFLQLRGLSLSVIAASVFGVGVLVLAYVDYAQYGQNHRTQHQLQDQLAGLTAQANQNFRSAQQVYMRPTVTPSSPPVASSSSLSSSSSSAVSSASSWQSTNATVNISQFGVNLMVYDPIGDTTYKLEQSGAYAVAAFTTSSLQAAFPNCGPGVLGSLVKKPMNASASSSDVFVKSNLGGYNYFYLQPSIAASCATNATGQADIAQYRSALQVALAASLK